MSLTAKLILSPVLVAQALRTRARLPLLPEPGGERRGHGVQHVVFAPLPPLHQFPGLPQPLRCLAGADARRHNAALAEWAASRADVSCVDMEAPLNRGVMAADGFHPGEPVYRCCAATIALHIANLVFPTLHLDATP